MIVPGSANPLLLGDAGYNIQRSLRFRSSASAYLSRTPAAAGNRKTWTWSGWVKRGKLSATSSPLFFVKGSSTDTTYLRFGFDFAVTDAFSLTSWNSTTIGLTTTQVFRDPSAWYHIVVAFDTTQATASNRVKIYVNGAQVTSFASANYPALNTDYGINNNVEHDTFAAIETANYYTDGYLAEVNFIDGQALTPSSFGQTDAVTGVWTPKKYAGTYGTNGFYLPFSDNTSATTLAYDKSGNGNNWTPNNISTTAGATYDSMTDVPTLTSATAANYCTLNPLTTTTTALVPAQGNLYFGNNATYNSSVNGTIGVSSGKWYWEVQADSNYCMAGITALSHLPANIAPHQVGSQAKIYYSFNGQKYDNGNNALYGATWTTTDVVGVALDLDAGTITFYKNNTSQGTAYTGLSGTYWPVFGGANGQNVGYINFGQRPFSYTPPTGFKALNTFNLPDPTIKKPNQYMDATTYTGNGSTQSITNGGFQPDFVWTKGRSQVRNNVLYDSSRGTLKQLYSNQTAAELSVGGSLTSFNSNGFTLGGDSESNWSSSTYVAWQWKKGATPGFDIVTYTGNGVSGRTVAHSLGVAPKMTIIKQRNSANSWNVWAYANNAGDPDSFGELNGSAAWYQNQGANGPYTITPSATELTLTAYGQVNGNGNTYVAYLWAEIAGFSKFGSYTGNGSNDGSFIYLGFRARWVCFKCITTGSHWVVCDTARDPINAVGAELAPNNSNAENGTVAGGNDYDIVSNGIKMRYVVGNEYNVSGYQYIYAAFAENPFKYSLAR